MKLLQKLTAIIILLSMLITLNSPIISYAEGETETNTTGESTTGEQTEEVGTNYEIKETEEWDISKNGDGSVIAKWTLDDKTITISGSGEMKNWKYDSKEDWHNTQYTNLVDKIEIKSGVTNIGGYAFDDLKNVIRIVIPNSVISIESFAFFECSSLMYLNIPDGVTNIGSRAFERCYNLEYINIGDNTLDYTSIDGVLYNKDLTKLILYPAGKQSISFNIPTSVISIGSSAFEKSNNLKNITIPNSVKSIGEHAFARCSNLENITIPNSVTYIGSYAFYGCSSLTTITIPSSVTTIETYLFTGCSSLESIILPNSLTSIKYNAFCGCTNLTSITIPNGVTTIESGVFSGCSSLKDITIPNGVTTIKSGVFSECSSLKNIIIPTSVTDIGGSAFHKCSSLTSIIIPNSVTNIGENAFERCISLTSITIPNSVTQIKRATFYECSSLESITIPNSITSIDNIAFSGCSNLTNITIPKSVTSIGDNAFRGCSKLTYLDIPSSVTSMEIGEKAFEGCSSLTNITIPNCVTNIGNNAFRGCSSLTNITIPDSVTNIENYAFSQFKGYIICSTNSEAHRFAEEKMIGYYLLDNATPYLETNYQIKEEKTWDISKNGDESVVARWTLENKKITISGNGEMREWSYDQGEGWHDTQYTRLVEKIEIETGITNIGSRAFDEWSSLKSITIPNSVTSIGAFAFRGCSSLKKIIIPSSVSSIESSVFDGCRDLLYIDVDESNLNYVSLEGVLYNKNKTNLIKYSPKKQDISFTVPTSVTSIDSNAFEYSSNLTSIIIPNNVTSIETATFKNCSGLTNITIPNCMTSIEDYAFFECTSLANITIPNSVTSIGDGAFLGCNSLKSITIPNGVTSIVHNVFRECSSLTNIIIPESVTSIGSFAFYGCNSLTDITIPNSVTSIEDNAFQSCDSLKNITIPSSITKIGIYAFSFCTSLTDIEIPDSVTSIEDYMFEGCSSLTNITIPNSVTNIGMAAFRNCTSLKNINIPSSVTSIGKLTFSKCKNLTNITIPDSVTRIEHETFGECTSLKEIIIPNSVTEIDSNAFFMCKEKFICKKNSEAHRYAEEKKSGYFLDSKAPTVTYTPNGIETLTKSLKVQINVEDNYGVDATSLKYVWSQNEEVTIEEIKETFTNEEEITSPENVEGNIYLHVFAKDAAGNDIKTTSNAFNLDSKGPQLEITRNPEKLTNQNVTVTITSHEKVQDVEGWTLSSDKLKLIKVYEANANEEVTVKDLIGNETKANINVNNIDKRKPVVGVTYSKKELTNQNVTVQLIGDERLQEIEGWTVSEDGLKLTKEYDQNKTEEITVKDLAGNETKANINISNIDKVVPVVGVAYSNKELTKENVIVTITGNEKLQQIEGWTVSQDGLQLTKEFEENEKKEIDVKDLAGNIAKVTIEITNIDKKAPVIEGVKDKRTYANKATPKAVDENLESVKLEKEGQEVVGYENGTTITELGTYKITATDKVGHKTEVEFYIKDIPSTEEVVEYTVSPEGLTNQDVKVSVTKKENEEYQDLIVQMSTDGENYEAVTEKTITENGTVYIRIVKEEEGNTVEGEVIEVEIKNIDKTAPEAQLAYSNKELTKENVTATITTNEEIQEIEGWTRGENRKTLTKEYSENKTEEITIKDLAGNSTKLTIEITNIDKTAPEGQVTYSETNPTNKNVTATITANEEIQEVEGWTISQDKKKLTKEYNENKTEKVIIKDKIGNEKEVDVKVLNIDRTKPVVSVVYSTKNKTNKNVTVTITVNEKVQETTGWTLSSDKKKLTKEYSVNKTETITIKDLAGNTSNVAIEITNIDKTVPTANVEYSTINLTNQNVTVIIAANEEIQGITGWTLSNNKKTLTKIYQNNVEETIQVKDLAGNTIDKNISIKNIDKTKPEIAGVENANSYNDSVIITVTDTNPGTLLLEKDGEKVEGYTNGKEIIQEGTYKLTAVDKLGNTTIVSFTIKYVRGDLNKDSKIDMLDVLTILKHISQEKKASVANKHPEWKLSEKGKIVSDTNRNGKVEMLDVLKILQYIAAKTKERTAQKHPEWLNIN